MDTTHEGSGVGAGSDAAGAAGAGSGVSDTAAAPASSLLSPEVAGCEADADEHSRRGGLNRVVLMRNLSPAVTAEDVSGMLERLGMEAVKILLLPSKGHAFVEMRGVQAAEECVEGVEEHRPTLRGRPVYAVISNRTAVRFRPGFGQPRDDPAEPSSEAGADDAGADECRGSGATPQPADPLSPHVETDGHENNPPSRVVLLIVSNVRQPVTVPAVAALVTGPAAAALPYRVIVFARQQAMHALIEMPSVADAVVVVKALSGQDMYDGCNRIHAQFSRMGGIAVRFNNLKSFDFTNPVLAHGPRGTHPAFQGLPHSRAAVGAGAAAGAARAVCTSPVVLVSGFDEAVVSVRDLFALCGIFGDVHRVKMIGDAAAGAALVELASVPQAQLALEMLNGQGLFGLSLVVKPSHFRFVSLEAPAALPADASSPADSRPRARQADFSRSRAHRFRSHQHGHRFIARPCASLHLSNMPDGATEAAVADMLAAAGGEVSKLRFLDDKHHMCVAELQSTEAALRVIVRRHNSDFLGRYLRVSFARQGIGAGSVAPLASLVPRMATAQAARALSGTMRCLADDDTHDDFKPRVKVAITDENIQEKLTEIVKKHPIVLFMKGTPQQPMCGFSMRVIQMLNTAGTPYHAINVLDNDTVRQGIKAFSNWPTIPQLYVAGEFVGGCDIVTQLFEDNELVPMLEAAGGSTEEAERA